MRTTSAITIRTSRFPFAGVRWRPSKIGSVVTQFVAQVRTYMNETDWPLVTCVEREVVEREVLADPACT
jgi:hypothetical protein